MDRIGVIGAGAWGTALSIVLGRKQRHQVRLWAYEQEVRRSIETDRVNKLFLPGQAIPECVAVTGDLGEATADAQILVSAMPSQHCRRLFEQIAPLVNREVLVVSATK